MPPIVPQLAISAPASTVSLEPGTTGKTPSGASQLGTFISALRVATQLQSPSAGKTVASSLSKSNLERLGTNSTDSLLTAGNNFLSIMHATPPETTALIHVGSSQVEGSSRNSSPHARNNSSEVDKADQALPPAPILSANAPVDHPAMPILSLLGPPLFNPTSLNRASAPQAGFNRFSSIPMGTDANSNWTPSAPAAALRPNQRASSDPTSAPSNSVPSIQASSESDDIAPVLTSAPPECTEALNGGSAEFAPESKPRTISLQASAENGQSLAPTTTTFAMPEMVENVANLTQVTTKIHNSDKTAAVVSPSGDAVANEIRPPTLNASSPSFHFDSEAADLAKCALDAQTNLPAKIPSPILRSDASIITRGIASGESFSVPERSPWGDVNIHANPSQAMPIASPNVVTAACGLSPATPSLAHARDIPSALVPSVNVVSPAEAAPGAALGVSGSPTNATLPGTSPPAHAGASAPLATELDSASSAQYAQPQAGVIQGARLMNNPMQSEMHIDLTTRTFGNVEVHTLVRDSQVGLTIGSEHGDLRSWLAPEVHGLQAVLKRQNLHIDNMTFLGSGQGNSNGGGSSTPGQSSGNQLPRAVEQMDELSAQPELTREDVILPGASSLSIHA